MLSLYGAAGERNVRDSDAICSALQLINFLQDVAIDRRKDRIYIPLDDLASASASIRRSWTAASPTSAGAR